jgi:hypothetical protein
MADGMTCYERDETFCEDQMCLRTGCRLRNKRTTTALTPSREELLALADRLDAALQRHCAAQPINLGIAHALLGDILFGETEAIIAALRLAAKSAEVREATIEECAKIVEQNQETYSDTSGGTTRYVTPRMKGNQAGLAFAVAIRALSIPGQPKP